jgi:hypothetical protein
MADRLFRPSTRLILGLVLVVGALAHGCGRTSLDDGFGPGDGDSSIGGAPGTGGHVDSGAGGQAGAAPGGMSGGGQGGIGVGSTFTCGSGKCVVGMQSCCNRLDNGRPVQVCIAANDPMGCGDGFVLCTADVLCPRSAPSCCILAQGVGYCQSAGLPCPMRQ